MQGILGQRIAKKRQLCSLVLIKFSNKSRYRRRLPSAAFSRQWSANLIWSYAARRPRAASLLSQESATCRINWRCAAQNVFFSAHTALLGLFFLSRRASLMKSKFNKSAAVRTQKIDLQTDYVPVSFSHTLRGQAPVWPNFRPAISTVWQQQIKLHHAYFLLASFRPNRWNNNSIHLKCSSTASVCADEANEHPVIKRVLDVLAASHGLRPINC